MRILWVGDPPTAPTGYGGQAALFIPRLRRGGHDVALLAVGGSAGATYKTADGMTVYPTITDPRGNDIVAAHARAHHADLVITLGDPHTCDPDVYKDLPWIAWAPLDFETPTKATLRSLHAAKWIWSPSRHGEAAYRKAGLEADYVPHGIDTKVFCPGDRIEARRTFGAALGVDLDGKFLIVTAGANKGTPSRKGFFEMLSAFARLQQCVSGTLLYIHTDPFGIANGENLYDIMDLLDLDKEKVIFPPQYPYLTGTIPPSGLACAYRAADVYLSTSHGEGFGLPAIEAQACETPVILPDNTAQSETCFLGSLIETDYYIPFNGATCWRRPRALNTAAMLRAYKNGYRGLEDQKGSISDFNADNIFSKYMLPALEKTRQT